jgi:hypothetical protein
MDERRWQLYDVTNFYENTIMEIWRPLDSRRHQPERFDVVFVSATVRLHSLSDIRTLLTLVKLMHKKLPYRL